MATIQGTVKDALGNFARRLVRLHRKYDGALAGEALSNPSTGEFSISTSDQTKHYAVVHDQDSWLTYLPFDGANNDTVFFEWGGKPITANGSAKISTTESKYGGSAAYFDGSGDYLTTPTNPELAFGTLDFTIEAWVRLDAIGTERAIFDSRAVSTDTGLYLGVNTSGYLTAYGNNATILTATGTAIAATTWAHVALVKSAGTMTLYLNGVSVGSAASSYTITAPGSVVIGRKLGSTTNDFNGYMDDMRIQKGKAQYVANFNVPTVPHMTVQDGDPYWNNVVLGCHFDGQLDNGDAHRNSVVLNMRMNGANGSTTFVEDTGKVVTAYGNAQLSTGQKKYGTASLALDGTGDYVSLSPTAIAVGSSAFTLEAWVYKNAHGTTQYLFCASSANVCAAFSFYVDTAGYPVFRADTTDGGSSSGSWELDLTGTSVVPLNTWSHLAVVRSGNVFTLYLNGTARGSTTNSLTVGVSHSTCYVGGAPFGYSFNGYIDDLRITKGVARYTADFTPPTAELPALQRAFPDVASGKILTANGDAKIVSTQSKFGGYSAYFDGTGDYLSIPASADFDFGTGDFSVSFFVRLGASGTQYMMQSDVLGTSSNTKWWIGYVSGQLGIGQHFTANKVAFACTMSQDTWYHVGIARANGITYVFLDGVLLGSASTFSGTAFSQNGLVIGAISTPAYLNGYIDDLLITKGVGRQFNAVPTAAFPEQLLTFGQKNALIYDHLTPV